MAFFQDIAKKFGLLGKLGKQTLQTAQSRATARRVERQRLEAERIKPTIIGGGFFGDIAKRFNLIEPQEFIKPREPAVRPEIDIEKVERTKKAVIDFARIFPREGAGAVLTLREKIGGTKGLEFIPRTKFEKALLGVEPVKSLEEQGKEIIKGFGGSEELALKGGLPVGLLVLGIDLIPPLAGKAKLLSQILVKINKADEVAKTLKAAGVADDLVSQYAETLAKTTNIKEVEKIVTNIAEIQKTTKKLPSEVPLPRKIEQIPEVVAKKFVPAVSLDKKIAPKEKLVKVFREKGRVLVNSEGKEVFPLDIKRHPTPIEAPVSVRSEKKVQRALDTVKRKHGNTEIIIVSLKKAGLTDDEIGSIVLENGIKLIDTIKVKREVNGVLSAVITKDTLKEIGAGFKGTKLDTKWIPTKTATQKVMEAGRVGKLATLEYYELPQIFFDRTGLRSHFFDPVREAQRNASAMKTDIWKRFKGAGLWKESGIFTPDHFTLSKKEGEKIGRYFLERQGKGGGVFIKDLSTKERKFVEIFDDVIKVNEERFYKVARLNGKSPGVVENYAPIMTSNDWKIVGETGDMEFIFRKHPAFFSLKQRVEVVPFNMYELDYRKIAALWIDKIAQFNHLGEVGPQVKYLANSDDFRLLVGDDVWKTTNKWLQDTFNPQVLSPAEKIARFGRMRASIASLGLNFASVVKQVLTQIPLTIIEKAPPKLWSKFAKDFGIKIADLPSITERRGNAAIMDMQGKINKIFVGPLAKFDKINAQASLNRLLDKNYRKFLKEGREMTPEAQAIILKKSQDTLDMWYGGMTREQLPRAFRSEMGKLINMFIMPLTSQLNGFFYSVMKAKGIMKAEKLTEVIASAVAIAYLEQVITNLDVKWSNTAQMVKDTTVSLMGNIPILSQFVFAYYTDQPLAPSPVISSLSRAVQQTARMFNKQVEAGDWAFAIAELFGTPKQFRRAFQGYEIVRDGGVRDNMGKLLVPVTGTDEKIRAFLRGKYGTIATQDWIRNIGVKTEQRQWFVPEVEFLQNGDYNRKAELYRGFDMGTKIDLYNELSEGQQNKLDKALKGELKRSLEDIFETEKVGVKKKQTLEEIFK